MKILVIADPHIRIPPVEYGGTERIVHLLCQGLAAGGHQINLIAAAGSQKYGGQLFLHRAPSANKVSRIFRKLLFQITLRKASRGTEMVICHGRTDYLWWLYKTKLPLVVQYQNPVDQQQMDSVLSRRSKYTRFVGVSIDQMSGIKPTTLIDVIPNAIPIQEFPFTSKPQSPPYFVFLGRITKNKGVHIAIEAARLAGTKLVIAGNIPDAELGARDYFEGQVRPSLGSMVEYVGSVNHEAKTKLLGGATGMLFPIQWREPFGIVMPEALACGCPVIAWQSGSVPEVIRHGVTGFIVDSVESMVTAIRSIDTIDRNRCRQEAEIRFSPSVLVNSYLKVFESTSFT